MSATPLQGRHVLVVEDEYMLADAMERGLKKAGARVTGPAPSVAKALALLDTAEHVDAAILDINLGGEKVFPVADALAARGVPFLFATGYDTADIPAAYSAVERHEKPVNIRALADALSRAR